ncbi:MAG: beta-N-acetylhexosaminidase, partial [Alistipes sp.]|nr:beta-N-acetylhexosaminidase [Alistipes sp.]
MKLPLSLLLLLSVAVAGASNTVPYPNNIVERPGKFTLTESTVIVCPSTALRPLAEYLRQYVPLRTVAHDTAANAVTLRTDRALPDEGYRLDIDECGVTVTGGSCGGVFNGIQTLLQLLPPQVYERGLQLPSEVDCVAIEDAPKYGYRGVMLDVARTWMDADRLKRYIDILSHHKINRLHLHLSDDEAWRIEIKSHPELAAVGGFRGGDSPIAAVYGKWGERYGGYYTQEQMRSIIRYAAVRNIEIIPEIDLPGHSRAMAQLHPEILCDYPCDNSPSMGYECRNAWCVARDDSRTLLDDIISEICTLFPSPYIHIGGDEVETSQWERCPDCRALMRRRGLNDERDLEDIFMQRLDSILRRHGKSPAVWNEASRTGRLTRTARVYGWESMRACREAAAKGYGVVVMPGQWFYFDMRQSPREDGHEWAAIFDASKVLGVDLEKEGFTQRESARVIGFEGAFWSELYTSHNPESTDYPDYMLFPRVCALAEICWTGERSGWPEFYRRLCGSHYDRLSAMGVVHRLFPPVLKYADGAFTAATDDGSQVFYRREGDTAEHRLRGELRTDTPQSYTFRSRRGLGVSPEMAHESHYRTITPAVVPGSYAHL